MSDKPQLKIITEDPLGVLQSTKVVLENSRSVIINTQNLGSIADKVTEKFQQGFSTEELGLNISGNVENDVQLAFIEDSVNFCFWAAKDEKKWQVELPNGGKTEGGWYGLQACFDRGLREGLPILDANFLAEFSLTDAENFFRGINGVKIPHLAERAANFREAGKVLFKKFGGKFIQLLELANYDAIKLVKLITGNFPSFNDVSSLGGEKVVFLKRAQICANDINHPLKPTQKSLKRLGELTAFADYKLP